jgi:hypothetical protein
MDYNSSQQCTECKALKYFVLSDGPKWYKLGYHNLSQKRLQTFFYAHWTNGTMSHRTIVLRQANNSNI